MKYIPNPTPGEIIKEEFMKPLNTSAHQIAKESGIPSSTIQDILDNRCSITIDTSIRLGRLFNISDQYFLNLQNDFDIRNTKKKANS